MNQPTLFELNSETAQTEEVILYALGDFQSRGLQLADRELPLDRLLGAFKRAFEHFQISELTDEQIAETLEKLGAKINKLPSFVAKHPFRITISNLLAEKSRQVYNNFLKNE
ncbi:hypothetical protein BH20ACI4_BH20ACI4_28890 [soil metagenome]